MIDSTFANVNPIRLDQSNPPHSAGVFLEARHRLDRILTLRHMGGVFYAHQSAQGYRPYEDATLRSVLYQFLARSYVESGAGFKATASRVSDIVDAIKALTHLPATSHPPCWLDDTHDARDPFDFIQCANGLLYLPTRTLTCSTPTFFTTSGVDFPYQRTTEPPERWLRFLHQLWPEDADSQETLQEWIGYLLTARTHFQKIMMLVGPKRSGKGTIGRVIRQLLGDARVAGPTLANLGEQFGLAVLLHKSAALIADARISGRADMAVLAERLLSISGEDTLSIPRKFKEDWTGKVPVRFMFMTNELPRIEDVSGALSSRFIVLSLEESFYGREDHTLFDSFRPELPAILNWALDGWDRLRARGRFVQPESAAALIQQFEDIGSPISAFLRDRCTVKPGLTCPHALLYVEWVDWCKESGREHPGTTQAFGKNLTAAATSVKPHYPRIGGKQIQSWNGIQISSRMTDDDTF